MTFESKLGDAAQSIARLEKAIGEVIVGQNAVVREVLWGLLAGGHILLEGAPGLGKTLLVRTISAALDLSFSRIQFTPDLLPSDVVGTNVLVMDSDERKRGNFFQIQKGPIFGQLVLADEINRATPKTQSALLEAMAEGSVTISGTKYTLEEPFAVLATENPIEMEGTYPLPEAQLDRFLLKVVVPNPTEDELCEVLQRTTGKLAPPPSRVLDRQEILALRALCRDIHIAEPVLRYAARLVRASDPQSAESPPLVKRAVKFGAGVRGAQSLVLAAKAVALGAGRANVAFADIQSVALPVLRHRIIRSFQGEAEGTSTDDVIRNLLVAIESRGREVEKELGAVS